MNGARLSRVPGTSNSLVDEPDARAESSVRPLDFVAAPAVTPSLFRHLLRHHDPRPGQTPGGMSMHPE